MQIRPTDQWPSFDITDHLPTGTTVLEASAGTGKTWTIAALTTRYLAEGIVTLDDLLLITFTRSASSELRERVRAQLAQAVHDLADPGRAAESPSTLTRTLAEGTPEQVRQRRERLIDAAANFDRATIGTTHTFCLRMLAALGIAGHHDPDATIADTVPDLAAEVLHDLFLRRYALTPEPAPFDLKVAAELAREVTLGTGAVLAPLAPTRERDRQRLNFLRDYQAELQRRKRIARVLDYDDLQLRLLHSLRDPQRGDRARRLLRRQFSLVMVDEFQDTDPVQWEILRLAFHGHGRLLLIGDPKQSIYGFRGGDVRTYLRAVRTADHWRGLAVNYRSDEQLVTGLERLLGGLALGDPEITVRPVGAHRTGSRLSQAGAPIQLRQLLNDAGKNKLPSVGVARSQIAVDLAEQVAHLLRGPARYQPVEGAQRPVQPGDIAVLVQANAYAEVVKEELARVGVPAVVASRTSVLSTEAATHWYTLLTALEAPHRPERVRAVAISPFIGWSASTLASADESRLDRLATRVRHWSVVLAERGVAALAEQVLTETNLPGRTLRQPDGERLLTDLRHVAELLHEQARAHNLTVAGLRDWLRQSREDDGADAGERGRRLASDAAAVQVLTIHGSKGLEFPIVYLPTSWNNFQHDKPKVLRYHDQDDQRVLDISEAHRQEQLATHRSEEIGEGLRQLYVALTRAGSQVVAYWAPTFNTPTSALHRVLFGDRRVDSTLPERVEVPANPEDATRRLRALVERSAGLISLSTFAAKPAGNRVAPEEPPPSSELTLRHFTRAIDDDWRRTSYTGLTARAHDLGSVSTAGQSGVQNPDPASVQSSVQISVQPTVQPSSAASEFDEHLVSDEPDGETVLGSPVTGAVPADNLASPLANLPGGAKFGTVVHEVLENLDLAATDLVAELRTQCRRVIARRGAAVDADELARGLLPTLYTPFGGRWPQLTLAGFSARDRLNELTFELPLAGGDAGVSGGASAGASASTSLAVTPELPATTLAAIGDLWQSHLAPSDPLADYPARLTDPGLAQHPLRGYLTGSIDAVLRLPEGGYLVVDYKTNKLPAAADPLSTWDYRPSALAEAMISAHYPLQGLLYSVALHRFLRWRLAGYDPTRDLAGCAYLFLRGMAGPDTPTVDGHTCGVFGWRFPTDVVVGTSDLLAGETR